MAVIYSATYPTRSGDYDEYTRDEIFVMVEDDRDWLDLAADRPMARFPGPEGSRAVRWLTEHGCTRDDAERIVSAAISGKTSGRVVRS